MFDTLFSGDYSLAIIISVCVFLLVVGLAIFFLVKRRGRKDGRKVTSSFENINPLADEQAPVIERKEPTNKEPAPGKSRRNIFGGVIVGLFSILALRLWSLQIANSKDYKELAEKNMTSEVSTPARRGRILDCKGRVLVTNQPTITIKAGKQAVDDRRLIQKLSLVLGIPADIISRSLRDDTLGTAADREIARNVSEQAIAYIEEHHAFFPGVSIESETTRVYPYGSAAAQILGYAGPVTQAELDASADSEIVYESGDIVGKDGVEVAYETILQGIRGTKTYQVDVEGNPLKVVSEALPIPGNDVKLTLDIELQQNTDAILANAIAIAKIKSPAVNAGALIVLDVKTMGVLASSSYPTFRPQELSGGISNELWAQLTSKKSAYPLTNRVISGLYPAASTFKAFTGLAGLENGIIKSNTHHTCKGYWDAYGESWGQRCWIYPGRHGTLGLEQAINQSCDVFFYEVGAAFYERWRSVDTADRVDQLQDYLRSWGFGSPTGIDLPGEAQGRVPDAAWKLKAFANTPEEAQWQPGDMTNMCIGQGDILITPLQLARGYASLARRELGVPHVFAAAVDADGKTISEYAAEKPLEQPTFSQSNVNRIETGLKLVANRLGIFNHLPVKVASKTGTAEVAGKEDYVWFVAYAPANKPRYCVACVIEQAKFGSTAASQSVLKTLEAIYAVKSSKRHSQQQINER